MKKSHFVFSALIVVLLLVTACTTTATPTPGVSALPPLPTANVPPLATFDTAIQRWENSGNTSYYLEVEEKGRAKEILVRLVVKDQQVRAAQILDRTAEGLSEPAALPLDEAQAYTVDSLLAKLRRDAAGEGPVPVNLQVVFDQSTGLPSVAFAEALPTYTDAGTIATNREYSYSLVTRIKALIEDVSKPGKDPILAFTRSNGPEAFCDSLMVYPDSSSLYGDDCRQTSLPQEVPANLMERLDTLRSRFGSLDEMRESDGQIDHLQLTGTGTGTPDPQTIVEAWTLAERLNELLSYPLGAGVVLMYIQNNDILGMDMQRQTVQPARIARRGELRGATLNQGQNWLAYTDDSGLRLKDIDIGEEITLLEPTAEGGNYLPRAWNPQNVLLVNLVPATNGGTYALSVLDVPGNATQELPLPNGVVGYGCDTGAAWSPDGSLLAVTGLGYGAPCNMNPGLTIIDLDAGTAETIVAQSVASGTSNASLTAGARRPAWSADGEWIAFSLDENATAELSFPSRLYVVHPDGRGLAPITTNVRGSADFPVWAPNGLLYYGLQGASTTENGIYRYDISTGEATLLLPGEDLAPISISPDGQFLAYFLGDEIHIYTFLTEQDLPEFVEPRDGMPAQFVGWLAPPEE